ncbi:MAG: sensor histidine kinase, partial [Candidatus Paceibacteria bacterium]
QNQTDKQKITNLAGNIIHYIQLRFSFIFISVMLDVLLYFGEATILWARIAFQVWLISYMSVQYLIHQNYTFERFKHYEWFVFGIFIFDLATLSIGALIYGFTPVIVLGFMIIFLFAGFMFRSERFQQLLFSTLGVYYISFIITYFFKRDFLIIQDSAFFTFFVYLFVVLVYMLGFYITVEYIKGIIQEQQNALIEQNRLKSDFMSTSAHQMRTPIAGAKWILDMAIDGDLGKVSDEQKTYFKKARNKLNRMLELVGDLLKNLEINDSKLEYNFENVEVYSVIQQVSDDLEEQADRKQMDIQLTGEDKQIQADIAVKQMKYVLENLLSNAIKYGYEETDVVIDWYEQDAYLYITVNNQGIGIPDEDQEKVFQRFYRAENASNRETTGTGLGLSISKRIIENHEGEIWFESEEGESTKFFIRIPITQS